MCLQTVFKKLVQKCSCKLDFSVEILVSKHNLQQGLDGEKPGTVHVLPHKEFEQEMCGKFLTQYASLDGGSDLIVLGQRK